MGIWKTVEEKYDEKIILPSSSFKHKLMGLNPSADVVVPTLNNLP